MSTAQTPRMTSQHGASRATAENVDVLALDSAARDRDRDVWQRILHVRRSPRPPSDRCGALLLALVERWSHRIATVGSSWLGPVP
jgi:hypothetical protein